MNAEMRLLRRSGSHLLAWMMTLAGIFTLSFVGRPLQFRLRSLELLHWFSVGAIAALALALLVWLTRSLTRQPLWRVLTATVFAASLLVWGATFRVPVETMHLFTFGLLGLLTAQVFGLRAALPIVALCAGADELLQLYLPSRVGDWADIRKDGAAAAVGWLIAWAQAGHRHG